jgi:tetratricopeptide (TPR) repeat protein
MDDMTATTEEATSAASTGDLLRRAAAFEKARRFDQAAESCREALAQNDRDFDAWFMLSGIELARRKAEAALEAIDRGLEHAGENAQGLCRRGSILRLLKRNDDAAESQRRAIAVDPLYAEAHNNLGNCLRDLGRTNEALQHYQHAVAAKPDYAQAHNNLGVAQRDLDQDAAALESFHRSLAINPNYANAYFNLGTTLLKAARPGEAADALRRAVGLAPRDGAAYLQLAGALMVQGRFDEAEPSLRRAVALSAGNAEAEFDLSLMLLERGRFKQGWKHYEARWRVRNGENDKRPPQLRRKVPDWTGEPLEGKSILIQSEQGLGDILQFSRYVPLLAGRGAHVTFLVPAMLERLLAPIAAVAAVKPKIRRDTLFDYRRALLSLPGLFGTELQSIPRTDGAYLFAEPDRVERWGERLGPKGFKIAVCWQGNPTVKVDKGRSIPLAAFAPLASLPGVRLISLQKQHGLDQLAHLPAGMAVELLGPSFDEGPDAFLDTAAVIKNCDLVVTSDTAIAHLAGALDAPTWVGLSTTADWRWLRDRSDSPWYRSLTLFRQRTAGDWSTIFAEMAEALGGKLAEHPKTKL